MSSRAFILGWACVMAVVIGSAAAPSRGLAQGAPPISDDRFERSDGEPSAGEEPAPEAPPPTDVLEDAWDDEAPVPEQATNGAPQAAVDVTSTRPTERPPPAVAPERELESDPRSDVRSDLGSARPRPAGDGGARAAPAPGGVVLPEPEARPRPLSLRPPAKPVEVVTEAQLRRQVEQMVEAYRLGAHDRFKVERAELENMRDRAGVQNVVLASAALIRQTQSALSAGSVDVALDYASSAVRLSPDLVAARRMQLHVLWTKDWTQVRSIGGVLWDLLAAQFGSFRNQVAALTSALVILSVAALLTIFVFALAQLIKYIRYPAHDIGRRLPGFIGGGEIAIFLALLVILPIAFGFGPGMAALIALVIVAGYQTSSERLAGRVMIVMLGLAPMALCAAAPLVTFHGSLVDDMATATSEAFARRAERRLLTASGKKRNRDPISALILARRKRLRGDLRGADHAYERALMVSPGNPVGLNNRGVVQFMMGRHEAAISLFSKAASANRPESILNLATIKAEQGDFEEATRLLERARQIDGELAARYTNAQESGDAAKQLFEAEIETGALWLRLLEVDRDVWWFVAESLWARLGGYTPLWSISIMASLALLASLFIGRRASTLSTACPKCGTPARRDAHGQLCEQCTSVFLTAVAVEPRLRAKKESEVRAYQRRRRLIERSTAVVAGLGQFWSGRTGTGLLLFFSLSVALVAWAFRQGIMVHDWQVAVDAAAGSLLGTAAVIVAAVLSLISVWQALDR